MSSGLGSSMRAVCNDFYVNQKVSVKLDLPRGRETVLELFERIRRQHPELAQFRRYKDELALESAGVDEQSRWVAIRSSNIRSGVVNPPDLGEAYALHAHVLEVAPYFLSISPLDVDFVELLYGMDLQAQGNHDAVVHSALLGGSALGGVLDLPGARTVECQPVFGVSLGKDLEAHVEVKTRGGKGAGKEGEAQPISVYLTMRRYNPATDLKALPAVLEDLARRGEELLAERVVPGMVVPIRDALLSGNA